MSSEYSSFDRAFAFIFISILWFVLIPLSIKWNIELYNSRNMPAIERRYYPILAVSHFFLILYFLLARPLEALIVAVNMTEGTTAYQVCHWVNTIAYIITLQCCFLSVACRIFMLFFSINWNKAVIEQSWSHLINETHDAEGNWFIRNRASIGTASRAGFAYSCLMVVTSTIISVCSYFMPDYWRTVNGGLVMVLTIIGYFIRKNTPVYNDAFFIRDEMKNILLLAGFLLSIYVINLVCEATGVYPFLVWCMVQLSFSGVGIVYEYLTIPWVLNKFTRSSRMKKDALQKMMSMSDIGGSDGSQNDEHAEMLLTLKSHSKFSALMMALFYEFSSENLLCVTELTQFQMWCLETHPNIVSYPHIVELPNKATFPQSSIVADDTANIASKVQSLFDKYIVGGSEFEVNIKGGTKRTVQKIVNQLSSITEADIDTLAHCFDTTIAQLLSLLRGSYHRWRETTDIEKGSIMHSKQSSQMSAVNLKLSPPASPSATPVGNHKNQNSGFPHLTIPS